MRFVYLLRSENSLISDSIPCSAERFPVPLSREFSRNPEAVRLFRVSIRRLRLKMRQFPVFPLLIRGFGSGEQFASDCAIRQAVADVHPSAKNPSKSARGRGFLVVQVTAEGGTESALRRFDRDCLHARKIRFASGPHFKDADLSAVTEGSNRDSVLFFGRKLARRG